ncbi:MAG: D-alanyl-D-alanine carboxypeptidase family protein [Acetobacteraceae bacterium]
MRITRRAALGATAGALFLPGLAEAAAPLPLPPAPPGAAGAAAGTGVDAMTPLGPVPTVARYAILVDYNTGATLLNKNADVPNPPSSMTKLMTIYLTFQALKAGRIKLDTPFLVSKRAWRKGGSKMFVPLGQGVSVADLIRGVFVDSGNDAAIVLAQGIGGTEAHFVAMMNQEAKKLGLTHSHFMNPTGWPAPGHVMSVRDIATLCAAIIRDFPEYYHFAHDRVFTFSHITQRNRQPLVMNGMADGLKTGHTNAGGYGLASSSITSGGRRIILVLNGLPTWNSRIREGIRLTRWGLANFVDVVVAAPAQVLAQAPVWLGTAKSVGLVAAHPLEVTVPHGWRKTARIAVDFASPVPAPVRRGAVLGRLTVSGPGVPAAEVPLLAAADVPRLGLAGRALAVASHFVTGN